VPSHFFAEWDTADAAEPQTPRQRRTLARRAGAILTLGALAAGTVLSASTAQADPSSTDWYRLRMCESSNNYSINTGNGYYGAYQFDLATWRSVGGSGYPYQASAGEQDARALILYRERGWQPWTCARILGLREDKDARSGRISDIHVPGGGTTGGVPAYPSTRSYSYGDTSSVIKAFQDQMHKRGAIPPGTGYYGSLTLAVVKRLQSLNGITSSGLLGPLTWHAAFAGKWSAPSTGGTPPPSVPAYPSTRSYSYGDKSSVIAAFQKQMNKRGAKQLQGTGQYGPLTLAVVKRLQSLNGLQPSGLLGPLTWHAAFAGKWSNP
jgi:peptidoglycan hydrolase-like protein with peptidoglycan-binding domain